MISEKEIGKNVEEMYGIMLILRGQLHLPVGSMKIVTNVIIPPH
jgi:hypothetical protein